MKLYLSAVLLLAILLLCSQMAQALQRGDIMIVTAAQLNVREGPCTDYEIAYILPKGYEVYFTGDIDNGCGNTW